MAIEIESPFVTNLLGLGYGGIAINPFIFVHSKKNKAVLDHERRHISQQGLPFPLNLPWLLRYAVDSDFREKVEVDAEEFALQQSPRMSSKQIREEFRRDRKILPVFGDTTNTMENHRDRFKHISGPALVVKNNRTNPLLRDLDARKLDFGGKIG